MDTRLILVILILNSGCLCGLIKEPKTIITTTTTMTTTTITSTTTTTTTTTSTTSTTLTQSTTTSIRLAPCCYPLECPQARENPQQCLCYFNIQCGQPTTTTTTLRHYQIKNYIPTKIRKIPEDYLRCESDDDCTMVGSCCGIGYGYAYAVNINRIEEWATYLTNLCQAKEYRYGCGWQEPQGHIPKCINNNCTLTYGGIISDGLPDTNFTYQFNMIHT